MSNNKLSESEMNEMLNFLRSGKKEGGIISAIVGLFIGLILLVAVIAYGTVSWGVLTYLMWYWFLVPVFPAIPAITLVQAIGLNFVIGLFKNHNIATKTKEDETTQQKVVMAILPWLTIGMAWLFKYICM
jgi:phosphate/sulfate permease